MYAIVFAICAFFSTLLGGLFGMRYHDKLHYIISFTAGVLVAVVFFDIMPEIFKITSKSSLSFISPMIALAAGFLVIHILEKYALLHHSHEKEYAEHRHPSVGMVGALGLAFHSLLDGVGIGLAFHADYRIGILVTIAVIAHDFSDGLNTVSLMLLNKNTQKKSFWLLILDAIAPIIGVGLTFLFTLPESALALYLGFFAGFLLYIGAADLLPEAHSKHSSYKLIALTILGMAFIFLVTRFS